MVPLSSGGEAPPVPTMDSQSKQTGTEAERPRTVLPPRRKGAPSQLTDLPGREAGEERTEDLPERRPGSEEARPELPLRHAVPKRPSRGRRIVVVIFSAVVPVLAFALVIAFVIKLDRPPTGSTAVPGGEVRRFSDGLVAVQNDPDSDQRVYYIVEAPREADAQIRFDDRVMTLVVRTEAGLVDISRSVDWTEAPYAMLINFLDLYGDTPKVPCDPNVIERYLESQGSDGSVAPLALLLRQPGAPGS